MARVTSFDCEGSITDTTSLKRKPRHYRKLLQDVATALLGVEGGRGNPGVTGQLNRRPGHRGQGVC